MLIVFSDLISVCHDPCTQVHAYCMYARASLHCALHCNSQRCVLTVSFTVDLLYGSNKSTGKETDKTHLCAIACSRHSTNDAVLGRKEKTYNRLNIN